MTDTLTWQAADRAQVDRDSDYAVLTNDGVVEQWSGDLLYIRLRPEFQIGRAVRMAVIPWEGER